MLFLLRSPSGLIKSLGFAEVAVTEPHAAYCAFCHGVLGKWMYLCRVFPFCDGDLQHIENAIHHRLIPSVIGLDPPSPQERAWIALPIRYGGLGLINQREFAVSQFSASTCPCSPFIDHIIKKSEFFFL